MGPGPMYPGRSSYCHHGISRLLSADSNELDTLPPLRRSDYLVPTLSTDYLDSRLCVLKTCLSMTVYTQGSLRVHYGKVRSLGGP